MLTKNSVMNGNTELYFNTGIAVALVMVGWKTENV